MALYQEIIANWGKVVAVRAPSNPYVSAFLGIRAKVSENLVVLVRDQFGQSVSGATVTVSAINYTTNELGAVDIPIPENTPTTVTAAKTGYTSGSASVTITAGAQKSQVVTMTDLAPDPLPTVWFLHYSN